MSNTYKSPREILSEIKAAFIANSQNLFSIIRDNFYEYDGALYGMIVARPNKSIATALGIQREVVILASNFDNLQVRTVAAAKRIIDESNGRFESNIILIIHQDRNGNANLKNWGREQGITILPVLYKQGLPSGDDLERSLCYELYSHDPFDITGPVSSDVQFYGRRTEALDLARKLQTGQIRSLLGIRKIGKTSVINRVIHELGNYNCLSVMIDCSRDEVWSMETGQFISAIASSIRKGVNDGLSYIRLEHVEDQRKIFESTKEIQDGIIAAKKPVILFFDEIDYITPASPTSAYWKTEFNSLWRNLRVVYQELARSDAKLSIVIGGVSSKWFFVGDINGVENSVLSFIPEEYLSPLPRGAATAMIKKVGKMSGLSFEEQSADLIALETADMPYWIRKACSFIHRNVAVDERPIILNFDRIKQLLETFIKNEGATLTEVAIRHLFRVYPELEHDFSLVLNGGNNGLSVRGKNTLLRYGVIVDRGSVQVAGNMLKEGYALYQEYASHAEISPLPQDSSKSYTKSDYQSIDEWADEIAIISRRRNVLEKKLREVALNFIKMDSLTNSGRKPAKDRVLAIFPENQRATFSHMTADAVIEKYNWSDLTKLFTTKEWTLFEKMIGDKNSFILNSNIINDRYDAHAKDADAADFALYRRSLKQIEDVIAKLG